MHMPGADPPVRSCFGRGVEAPLLAVVDTSVSSGMHSFASYLHMGLAQRLVCMHTLMCMYQPQSAWKLMRSSGFHDPTMVLSLS